MNKRQQTVLSKLKPKVKAFGFNKNVLKSIAAEIADKLDIEEDASDEDVNAKIDEAIEAYLPLMPMIQSQANSQFDEWKKAKEQNDNDDDEDNDSSKSSKSSKNQKDASKDDEVPAWAKKFFDNQESLKSEIAALKGEKIADTRKSKLEKLLKDTGKFGERKLRDFKRMKFENDEDFDDFFSEVEEDLKSENQDRANKGLEKLGVPAGGSGSEKKEETPEVLSEDEIKEIAKM